MRELYELYLELGYVVFEEKIKKPMELYLHTLHDCNVTSMSSFNTFDVNDMQSYKLGDATFDEDDLFSAPSLMRKFILMILCLLSMMIIVMTLMPQRIKFWKWIMIRMIHVIATLLILLPLLLMILLIWGVINF